MAETEIIQKHTTLQIITVLLIVLFMYTAVSKAIDHEEFRKQLANQEIPIWTVPTLQWLLPLSELLVVLLLLLPSTRLSGLYASAVLMLVFTGYMGLVVLNVFDRVPCSCGGVLKSMGFTTHFFFNLFFLILSLAAIKLQRKNRIEVPK